MYTNIISHECRLDYMLAVFSSHISLLVKYSSSVCPNHSIRPLSLPVASYLDTPCKIHMEPKNGALEDDFPFQLADLLGSSRQFSRVYFILQTQRTNSTFSIGKVDFYPASRFSMFFFVCIFVYAYTSAGIYHKMSHNDDLNPSQNQKIEESES